MGGRLHHRIQRVRERRRAEDREPTDAAAKVARDEVSEKRAEREVAAKVIDVDVHGERGDRPPPLSRNHAARVEAPSAEPVEVPHALVQANEHREQDRDVHRDARQRTAYFLDAPLPDGPLALRDVLRELAARLRRARR